MDMRLLIAEDDRMTADTLAKRLREEHYAVDVCYTGTDALDYAMSADYDVAVFDIMMPGIDGIRLVERLRGAGVHMPVLLLTARDAVSDRVIHLFQALYVGHRNLVLRQFFSSFHCILIYICIIADAHIRPLMLQCVI